ncbi:MAG: rod shape-determining protein MreD [Candidatus Omnitrophota bacterium]
MRRVNKLHFILSFLVLAIIQSAPFMHLSIYRIKPDLLLSGVLFFAFFYGGKMGLVSGIVAGLLKDALSGCYIFSNAFSFAIVGFIIGYYRNNLYIQHSLVQALATFVAAIAAFLFYYLFAQIFMPMPEFWQSFVFLALPTAAYSAFMSPFVFMVLKKTAKLN